MLRRALLLLPVLLALTGCATPGDHREPIRQALDLAPENPAILDSMGWVLYRMGRPEEALPYLEQAMESFPDQEIAAHLGEVLWVLGQKERARDAWRWGLEEDPDSELIPATIERLEAGPLDADS